VKTAEKHIHQASPLYPLLADKIRLAASQDSGKVCPGCGHRVRRGERVAELAGSGAVTHTAGCVAVAAGMVAR